LKTLRLILGDQLNQNHSWFSQVDPEVTYVMMELGQELTYTTHHIQKVVGFFMAMRYFSNARSKEGHRFEYIYLDNEDNLQDLSKNLGQLIGDGGYQNFEYQLPDEYRLDQQLIEFCNSINIPTKACDTEHFLSTREELDQHFKGKKTLIMESFYRMMRKKHNVLMDHETPVGGQWNYDSENRKKLSKNISVPSPFLFHNDATQILALLEKRNIKTIGSIKDNSLLWPINREQSLQLFDVFLNTFLPDFGDYQDALSEEHWSLFHSRISFALNTKLISPKEVIDRVEDLYRNNSDVVPLSSVEGFIRQILGWREFMRGIYWKFMPEYTSLNFFNHQRNLPEWFWTGETKMKCLSHTIKQSLDYAYAHHIQRLMITGNFSLLAGIQPDEIDQWYLGIYIDAIEWVEITNTRGMSQFADGGIVATKPYISSANYIHKMGHYCTKCEYNHLAKTGPKACPFNSLYWNFIDANRKQLENNPRMSMMYKVWDKNSIETKNQILEQADLYLNRIEEL
jgi:deoxyribodipyrimidine photolyase-related protein